MILKIGKPLRPEFLTQLQKLIGRSIKMIESDKCSFSLDSDYYFLNEVILKCEKEGGSTQLLKLEPYYFYNNLLGDELRKLIFVYQEKINLNNLDFSPIKIFNQKPFQISAIKILGQNRIRKWDEAKIETYFENQSIEYEVSDQLITHEFIIFEDAEKNQLVFSVEKNRIGFFKTKEFETRFSNDFYFFEELGLEDELNNGIKSKEQKIKLLHSLPIT